MYLKLNSKKQLSLISLKFQVHQETGDVILYFTSLCTSYFNIFWVIEI